LKIQVGDYVRRKLTAARYPTAVWSGGWPADGEIGLVIGLSDPLVYVKYGKVTPRPAANRDYFHFDREALEVLDPMQLLAEIADSASDIHKLVSP
jgi:hypothetical protein